MNREIKFRAKDKNNNWVYGDFAELGSFEDYLYPAIIDTGLPIGIDPETVGQYTGLKDKNGKEIFEGDVVKKFFGYFESITGEVKFYDGGWFIDSKSDSHFLWDEILDVEVLGNIYDNPELLGV